MLDSTSPATNSNCVCPYPCVRGLIGFLFRDSSRAASNADIEACGCTIVDTSFVSSLRVGGADVERELANESNWANGSSPAAADPGYPRIKVLVDEIPTNERPRSTKSRREEGASTYCDDGEIVEYVVGCGGRAIRASRNNAEVVTKSRKRYNMDVLLRAMIRWNQQGIQIYERVGCVGIWSPNSIDDQRMYTRYVRRQHRFGSCCFCWTVLTVVWIEDVFTSYPRLSKENHRLNDTNPLLNAIERLAT